MKDIEAGRDLTSDSDDSGELYETISYVRIEPPIVVPKPIIKSQTENSSSETGGKVVRFTLDSPVCFVYERSYSRNEDWYPPKKKHQRSREGPSSVGIIRPSPSGMTIQTEKRSSPFSYHPSTILIILVFLAILIVFLIAKKKEKVYSAVDLLAAFI